MRLDEDLHFHLKCTETGDQPGEFWLLLLRHIDSEHYTRDNFIALSASMGEETRVRSGQASSVTSHSYTSQPHTMVTILALIFKFIRND